MEFDLKNYRNVKREVIEHMKQLLPKWDSTQGFVSDGLVNPEQYAKEPLKIVTFLSEPYGWAEMGRYTEIEDQCATNHRKWDIVGLHNFKVHTARPLVICLWALFESLKRGMKVSSDEFRSHYFLKDRSESNAMLDTIVEKIGYINAKKMSKPKRAGTKANYNEVYSHAMKSHTVMKKQIESTAPDLIIVATRPGWDSLCDLRLLDGVAKNGRKGQIQVTKDGIKVIHLNHPSCWRSYTNMYKYFEIIYESVCS